MLLFLFVSNFEVSNGQKIFFSNFQLKLCFYAFWMILRRLQQQKSIRTIWSEFIQKDGPKSYKKGLGRASQCPFDTSVSKFRR